MADERRNEPAVAALGLFHVGERLLAVLTGLEMGQRLGLLGAAQLPVEVGREERQISLAHLGQLRAVDLDESEFIAQALTGTEDELRDGVLVQSDELADLRIALVLELAQREDESLAWRQLAVGDPDLVLLSSQQCGPLRVVLDVAGLAGSGTSSTGKARFARSVCFRKRFFAVAKRYAPMLARSGGRRSSFGSARTKVSWTRSAASCWFPESR